MVEEKRRIGGESGDCAANVLLPFWRATDPLSSTPGWCATDRRGLHALGVDGIKIIGKPGFGRTYSGDRGASAEKRDGGHCNRQDSVYPHERVLVAADGATPIETPLRNIRSLRSQSDDSGLAVPNTTIQQVRPFCWRRRVWLPADIRGLHRRCNQFPCSMQCIRTDS